MHTKRKIVSAHSKLASPKRETLSVIDYNTSSAASSKSSSSMSDISKEKNFKVSNKFQRKIKQESPTNDKMEESFLKLASVVSTHLESKKSNELPSDFTDEDDIFAKIIACQLKKFQNHKKVQ